MRADKNIRENGLCDKIETRLCDGLSGVLPGEVSCAVISGMGGMLVIDILKRSLDVVQTLSQLVLSPQLNVLDVRKFVHSASFKIINEEIVFEDGKFYNIISCEKGIDVKYSEIDYYVGRVLIEKRSDVFLQFAHYKIAKLMEIKYNIEKSQFTAENGKRLEEICFEIDAYKKIFAD